MSASIVGLEEEFKSLDINKRVTLNVGGNKFTTTLSTLTNIEPTSIFGKMFSHSSLSIPESDGSYFIDRSGTIFEYILNWLRDGNLPELSQTIEDQLLNEANFYCLD